MDSVTVTTSKSWFSRIGSALAGVIIGLLLFLGSFPLLTWNEGRAINRERTLKAGAGQVISISADERIPENNGKLVHFSGPAEAEGPVTDRIFGITADALKLRRDVEMYQWVQKEKSVTKEKLGGGEETTTTYTYVKDWSPSIIDSSQFHVPAGHENPDAMPLESAEFVAPGIHVGVFELPTSLVQWIDDFSPRAVTPQEAKAVAERLSEPIRVILAGVLFVGEDPANAKIGDLRVTFQEALPGPVSIVAAQAGNTLEPFAVGRNGTIELLEVGTFSAAAMFQKELEGNVALTWILRFGGFLMMFFGLLLITNVASVVASVIPFLGGIVGAGTGILAGGAALALTLCTISVAWLAYRPLIGIPLFLAAIGCLIFAVSKFRKGRKSPPSLPA